MQSHPVWVRGLKQIVSIMLSKPTVAPCMGAWIETLYAFIKLKKKKSHPVWVRGLKHIIILIR